MIYNKKTVLGQMLHSVAGTTHPFVLRQFTFFSPYVHRTYFIYSAAFSVSTKSVSPFETSRLYH